MHCNFVTPPDVVESVLVIDANAEQIEQCAATCKLVSKPYNVYFYHTDMDNVSWLTKIIERVDVVLQAADSQVPILVSTRFGPKSALKSPADYFNK
jgi:saccharopine dehydrogenase-like NADP-dependent oxidoreductase